jgi:hypothetical protein
MVKGDTRNLIYPKGWITEKRRSGLSAEKRVNRGPAGTASPNSTGRVDSFFAPAAVNSCMPLRVLTWASLRPATKQMDPEAACWVDRSANAPLQRVQAPIRHKQVPPYGLPSIYSVLRLSSPPLRWRGHWVLFLMILRSFLALRNQKQKGFSRIVCIQNYVSGSVDQTAVRRIPT